MKSILFLLFLMIISVKLFSQENQLKTGFYRIAEIDSCSNSGDYLKINDSEKEYCIYKNPIVTDVNFGSVKIKKDTVENQISYVIGIKLDSSGAELVKEATTKMVGQKVAFIFDDKVIAAPTVRDPITTGHIAIFCDEETISEVKKALHIN